MVDFQTKLWILFERIVKTIKTRYRMLQAKLLHTIHNLVCAEIATIRAHNVNVLGGGVSIKKQLGENKVITYLGLQGDPTSPS